MGFLQEVAPTFKILHRLGHLMIITVLKKQFEGNLGEALIFLRSANFNKAVAPDEAVKQALAMR